jgi:hypothetical protein
MNTINSKIDGIKFIRSFANLGLKDCKTIVEAWECAFGNSFRTSDLHQICVLANIASLVDKGEWVIDVHDNIIVSKPVISADILNLRG